MTSTIQRWGNSLALRIPVSLAKDIHLQQGSLVEVKVIKGEMVVKPKGKSKLSLARLLKDIKKSNLHFEHDWGQPTGKENW